MVDPIVFQSAVAVAGTITGLYEAAPTPPDDQEILNPVNDTFVAAFSTNAVGAGVVIVLTCTVLDCLDPALLITFM